MQHDKDSGLMDFSGDELTLLNEPRTPIDERVAPYLVSHVARLSIGCTTELIESYASQSETRARSESRIAMLRKRGARLDLLKIELSIVAADVEIKQMLDTR